MCDSSRKVCSATVEESSSSAVEAEELTEEMKGMNKEISCGENVKILDPDDTLMKRFQESLRAHLTRVDNKLAEEIRDLEANIKHAEKERETEDLQMYNSQQKIRQQQAMMEKYEETLLKLVSAREETEQHITHAKELRRNAYDKLAEEKSKEKKYAHELKRLLSVEKQLCEWERELLDSLNVSQRISDKDSVLQKELIKKKQEKDYVLWKLMDEVWKLENEIAHLDEQIKIKNEEKHETAQLVTDANSNLEALHREYANLCNTWNSVIDNIGKRDKVFCDLNVEREKVRKSFDALQAEIEKVKKDTNKQMENNENLTSLHLRIENDIRVTSKKITADYERIDDYERQSAEIVRYGEQTEKMYNVAAADYQYYSNQEEQLDKELAKLVNEKNDLESKILTKLEHKVMQDKAARHLNKLLLSKKRSIQEQELQVARTENFYGRNLLDLERLNADITNEKSELDEIFQRNVEKEREIDEIQKKIERCNTAIERKQTKVANFNKIIEQMVSSMGGEEVNPQVLKIMSLERNIQEIEQKNQKAQQLWLREESSLISLNQQKESQSQELNRLNKIIIIMEQKNHKIELELEKFQKEESSMDRRLNLLQQELAQINSNLVVQKELRNELEDKNSFTKNEYAKTLQEAELDLIKLQNDIKEMKNQKLSLDGELKSLQQESLSWEKKVQLAHETTKKIKDEHNTGGDIGKMKSEIHKMEMRLAHLRRAQEKLINDMEYCVARRESILNKVMGKVKKDPKVHHNKKFVVCKRMDDQKLKIKQFKKDLKQTENNITDLEKERKDMLEKVEEGEKTLKMIEDVIPDVNKQIVELELVKHHNLKVLVFKQRKVKLLQDIKNGHYKISVRSENALNEELQNERILHNNLKEIMENTMQDFPLLENDIRKILLTLQIV